MPTFAYWRRDQRRSAVPPAPPLPIPPPTSSKGGNESPVGSPLQLPALPDTPILTRTLGDAPFIDVPPPPTSDSRLETDTAKLDITTSTTALSSSFSPAAPSPFTETEHRPHSSSGPGERDREPALISSDYSQLPFPSPSPQQDQASEGEPNSKPNSPFRRSFVGGKGLRTLQAQPVDTQKRSPTAAAGNTGHFRFRASPDESSPDKQNMQKEFKAEGVGAVARRAGDRDISADHTHHKSGKAMLHLLNPMSLLARRRSSQVPGSRTDDANIGAQNLVPAIPDDYDPRIRGNIVHDFSAPRPRRNLSGPDANTQSAHEPSPSQSGGPDPKSPWSDHQKRLSDHSPVFKEHFEDDQNVLQVENKGYLQSTLLTNQSQPGYEKSIPVFARKLPSRLPDQNEDTASPPDSEPASDSPKKTSPPPADTQDQDQDTIPYVPSQLSGLPKHFKSNASRFSFDMNGVESSVQEKLLEEKHKEKAAARRLEQSFFDDFDDDFDNEILDDVDGLEERIPGVNADADDDDDDDDYNTLSVSRDVNGEVKSWAVPGLSPVAASPITPAAPQPSQFASYQYEDSPFGGNATQQSQQVPPESSETKRQGHFSMSSNPAQTLEDDDDDLYFDDGDFGDLTLAGDDENKVDESIFDDESNHLFAPNPAGEHVVPIPSTDDGKLRRNDSVAKESVVEEDGNPGLKHMPSVASDYRVTASIKRGPLGEPIPNMGPTRGHGGVLTEQNLEVLHHALAFAANEAATKSRFERTFSVSEKSIGRDSVSGASQTGEPGLMSDDSRLSQAADIMTYEDAFEDLIYDDDALYDDPIVAAANAEALENDDEGFYGQEFGFYAQAHGACDSDSELTNGGYFGPRGVDGISRSHSGGGKFQEPSLTPITERSEWSTRNSMISLKAHGAGHSNASLASPGLAQLVDMGNLDDEMSLSALMKLRRGAWGGSNGSLRSSAGSPPPHTLTSSNRGSFIAASEASPTVSDVRPFSTDDGLSAGGHTSERPSTEAF